MCGAYPELGERRAYIVDRIEREEGRFLETLSKGLALLEDELAAAGRRGEQRLSGETAFRLYDTFGFPLDLTEDILRGRGMTLDQSGFDAAMQTQRERARAAWKGSGDARVAEVYGRLAADLRSAFKGYTELRGSSWVRALLVGGESRASARQGEEVEVVVDETPFYPEGGGQVGDRGVIRVPGGLVQVEDTQRPAGELIVHRGRVTQGEIQVDARAELEVDAAARAATVRNHSGTHLLHAALRRVLGPQAMQKGSLVAPGRLRFDFTHDAPLETAQLDAIEDFANEWIEANLPANVREMSYPDAIAAGAIAIFEEKYGERVRVISFGEVSTELCGGTHARATGDIGLLKILSDSGIASGVRRIEAATGPGRARDPARAGAHARARGRGAAHLGGRAPRARREADAGAARGGARDREAARRQARRRLGRPLDAAKQDRRRGERASGARGRRRRQGSAHARRPAASKARQRRGAARGGAGGPRTRSRSASTPDLVGRFRAGDLVREVAVDASAARAAGGPISPRRGGSDPVASRRSASSASTP